MCGLVLSGQGSRSQSPEERQEGNFNQDEQNWGAERGLPRQTPRP